VGVPKKLVKNAFVVWTARKYAKKHKQSFGQPYNIKPLPNPRRQRKPVV